MPIYFLVLVVPLVIGLLQPPRGRKKHPGLWIYFAVLLFFCGFRFEVGADWEGYRLIYQNTEFLNYGAALATSEPGFFLLNKISDSSGLGFKGVIFFSSLIFLGGCFSYARKTSNPWLALAVVMPYLIFIISLSGLRQASAIGLGLYLFAKWERTSILGKVAFITLAVSFHNSAGVLLLFMIFDMKGSKLLKLLLTVGVILFTAYGLNTTEVFEKYATVYVTENLISGGAFFHVLLTALPAALYLLFRKRISKIDAEDTNVFLASILTLALMPFLALSSTGIDRLTLYFSFVQMWTYPALVQAGVMSRTTLKICVALLVLAIFFVYFLYGTHASAYVPYKNILLN